MQMHNIQRCLGGLLMVSILAACQQARLSPYRMPVDQGQRIEQAALAQVSVGMSKAQVVQLLGEPLLRDIFHANRWDYPLQLETGRADTRTISIVFEGERVSKIIQP